MGQAQALVLALALTLGCAKQPPVVFGARMPKGCVGKAGASERCVGWLFDRLMMTAAFTPYRDAAIGAYVARVGQRLVATSGDRRTWAFVVTDDSMVQAFAGLGTTVFITRGAIALLRDESELAGVLGHEIGHVLGGHSHEAFEELTKDLGSSQLTEAEQVRAARDDEIQADETAVLLLARAGYDPHGVERMLRAYAATSPADGQDPTDHHPVWTERIARIQAVTAGQPGTERGEAAFRAHVAQLVVGADPRAGRMVGDAAVFAVANVAVELPNHPNIKPSDDGSITFDLDAANSIDLRVVGLELAKLFPTKDDGSGVISEMVFRGSLALAITSKGPKGAQLARQIKTTVRPPRAAELQAITPTRIDLDAPRLLWLPPPPKA